MNSFDSRETVTHDILLRDLRRLGIMPGMTVLVHTSMRGLGYVDGGAATVIAALLDAVGEEGTLLFPTLNGSAEDGPDHPPVMDVRTTRCAKWVGVVPETARTWSGAVRSLHPTHSVTALGANQAHWTAGHELVTSPCDAASPYARLKDEGGYILLLGGVTQNSNTSLHCLEELADVPYHLQPDCTDGTVIDADGRSITVRNRLHSWRNPLAAQGRERDFELGNDPLDAAGAQVRGKVGASESTLINAGRMRDVLLPLMRENPLFLLTTKDVSD